MKNRSTPRVAAWIVLAMGLTLPALGECPIPDGGTLYVQAPWGNLVVETSGSGAVHTEVTFPGIEIEETCFEDHVEITGTVPERVYENVDWRIRVPASVHLDLVTLAGSIRIQNTGGNLTARTQGGSVTVGDIEGSAAISTQGGAIVTGNIGGGAELRSLGGEIRIGDVGGSAELDTAGGSIAVGVVSGSVTAKTGGGSISVEEVRGPLVAFTEAGDISVGSASGRVDTQTGGGNIVVVLSRGPFRGMTDFGNVEVGRAESSIEAVSGGGNVTVSLMPANFDGDLHVTLEAGTGNATLSIPPNMPATLEAIVDRRTQIRSDFPLKSANRPNIPEGLGSPFTVAPSVFVGEINGGGHAIRVRASGGEVGIRELPK